MKPTELLFPGAVLALGVASIPLIGNAHGAEPAQPLALNAAGVVVVQAGTILPVSGAPITGGGTLIVDGDHIVAVGKDLAVPPGARVVDYGPDAVIAPGFVSADSNYGAPRPSERSADPTLRAIDAFDPYANFALALQEGVTTTYLTPARSRLIAGQGAVVKLAGEDEARRVLSDSCVIHGAISAEARSTPGYWKPPVPATVDVGMGVEQAQLPRSLMGAIVALEELVAIARGGADNGDYGPDAGPALRELVEQRKPWRIAATNPEEIRAALAFFEQQRLPLILDDAMGAGAVAKEIHDAGVSVIVDAPFQPNSGGRNLGKDRDSTWPVYDTAAKLAAAGARFAIAPGNAMNATDLRFAAGLMSRGGLSRDDALRAITLSPAEILGVSARVGSLEPGKDADFVVFNGHPLDLSSSLVAAWVDGNVPFKAYENGAVVVEVDELHTGDGEVLSPGQLLMVEGRITEVGRKVGHPAGATVVRAKAATPGMIDALGHLGLDGSTRVPPTRFEMKRIVEPGDRTDERVAKSGVTTVVLSPRGASRSGAPMLAYKPAGRDLDRMIIADPIALRFQWTDRNRLHSGAALKETLTKAVEYQKRWDEYEKKKAAWTPPKEAPAAASSDAEKKDGEGKDAEAKKDGEAEKKDESKSDAEKKDGEKKDDDKDKKKKKKDDEKPKPVTGAWETHVVVPPLPSARLRIYVKEEADGSIHGSLRCSSLTDDLVDVSGKRTEKKVALTAEGTRGTISIDAEETEGKLKGKVKLGETTVDVELAQTSTEYEVVARPERRKEKEEPKKEVKGEPKAPAIDPELEPLRRAMSGDGAVLVQVERSDEILACVDAFEGAGIKPILLNANEAWKVIDRLRGRVAGILLSQRIVEIDPEEGIRKRNRYQELVNAGIPVAFRSDAEEGAADLPVMAAYAVAQGMSPEAALRALTSDAARMYGMHKRVGKLAPGLDADVVLFDGSPLDPSSSVLRVWVGGREVR